jgi:superfamily II DNA or RNA helicase
MTSSLSGSISFQNNQFEIRFRYNTDIFKKLTALDGVSYDKERKCWLSPLRIAPLIFSQKQFSKQYFRYDFDEAEIAKKIETLQKDIELARVRALADPFCVRKIDIELLSFDVIARETDVERGWIELGISKSRRAKKILSEARGVFAIGKKKKFLTNASVFPELLKIFREQQLSFAVEEELSLKLKSTSSLRSETIRTGIGASRKDLECSFLLPYWDISTPGNKTVDGVGFFTELRNKIIPSKKGQRLTKVDPTTSLQTLYKGKLFGIPIFQTNDASKLTAKVLEEFQRDYQNDQTQFADELLLSLPFPYCWRVDEVGKGGLHISNQASSILQENEFSHVIKEFDILVKKIGNFGFFLEPKSHQLPHFIEVVKVYFKDLQKKEIPRSIQFIATLKILLERASRIAAQNKYQTLKDTDLSLVSDSNFATRLYPHQRVAVRWILENESGMLGDDMGLGKTLSVLTAFNESLSTKKTDFLLVICPNSLVRTWLREAQQWFPSLSLRSLPDSKKEREGFLESLIENRQESLDGLVVNFEAMRIETVRAALEAVSKFRTVFLTIDESQRIKNPQSKTFQALKSFALNAKKRFLLSGTPTPRDVADLWGQVFIIDKGERFGSSFTAWLKTVAELGTKWSEFAVKRFIPSAVEEVSARTQEILLRRKKEDVVSLPEKVFIFRDVDIIGDQKKRFDQIREELLIQVGSIQGREKIKTIESILEEYLRAVQVCSNPRLIDPTWVGEPAKFKELDDIVENIVKEKNEKLVIWTNYLLNIHELCERYKEFGALPFSGEVHPSERQQTINEFQKVSSKNKILVAIPAAGGVGITLTAAQTCVYVDRTWNAEHWLQSIDRVHRIGQTGTVTVIVLNGSKVDELIGYNLYKKKKQMDQLLQGDAAYEEFLPSVQDLLDALR